MNVLVMLVLAGLLSAAANLAVGLSVLALMASGIMPRAGPPPWLFVWLAATAVYLVVTVAALTVTEVVKG